MSPKKDYTKIYCSACNMETKFKDLDLEKSFLYERPGYRKPILICKSCCESNEKYNQFLEFNKSRKRLPLSKLRVISEYFLSMDGPENIIEKAILENQYGFYRSQEKRKENIRIANSKGKHTKKDIELLKENQQGLCYWCRNVITGKQHIDHIIAIVHGGSNSVSNLCISCHKCNIRKWIGLPSEFIREHKLNPLDNRWLEQERFFWEELLISVKTNRIYIKLAFWDYQIDANLIKIFISHKNENDEYKFLGQQYMRPGNIIKFIGYDFIDYKFEKIKNGKVYFKNKILQSNEPLLLTAEKLQPIKKLRKI